MDVFVAQAAPGQRAGVHHRADIRVRQRLRPGSTVEQQLQFNPPNLPMFRQGPVPFMGDYIDLAPSPPFVLQRQRHWLQHRRERQHVSHAVWTDNRDVRPPKDGNWANYTPVTSTRWERRAAHPTQQVPACEPGQVGMRNQNIYTARVTDGLFVSAPGNNKQFNGFQRAFVIVAENASAVPRIYRLIIENQPAGGQASFLQFGPALTTLDVFDAGAARPSRGPSSSRRPGSERAHSRVGHRGRRRRRPGCHRWPDRHGRPQPRPAEPGAAESGAPESGAAEPRAAEHCARRNLQPGHQHCARRRAEPAEPGAAEPEPAEPQPAEPHPFRTRTCRTPTCRTRTAEPGAAERYSSPIRTS